VISATLAPGACSLLDLQVFFRPGEIKEEYINGRMPDPGFFGGRWDQFPKPLTAASSHFAGFLAKQT
jgi:hypothetical protein